MLSSWSRRSLLVTVVVGASFALPSVALANTYCVNDPACVTANGSGSAEPDIAAAVAAANANAGADTVQIGASDTPYALASTVTSSASDQITIVGAGPTETTIETPDGASGLQLQGPSPSITGVGFVAGVVSSTDAALVITAASGVFHVTDIRVRGIAATRNAVIVSGTGVVSQLDVALPPNNGFTNALLVYPHAGNSVLVEDSTLEADETIDHENGGTLTVERVQARAYTAGMNSTSYEATTQADHISSSLFVLIPGQTAPQPAGAFYFAGNGMDNTVTSTLTASIEDTTIIGLAGGTPHLERGVLVSATGGQPADVTDPLSIDSGRPGLADVTLSGVIIAGAGITIPVAVQGTPSVASLATASASYSDFDDSLVSHSGGGTFSSLGHNVFADPLFVDPTSGDYHLRWNSPVIDPAGAHPFGIGAYQYHPLAPVVAPSVSAASVLPGAALTFTANAHDQEASETAALTYGWSIAGVAGPATATVVTTAPATPGSYTATVTVTDPTGMVTIAAVPFTVTAPAGTTTPLVDTTPPMKTTPVILVFPKTTGVATITTVQITTQGIVQQLACTKKCTVVIQLTITGAQAKALGLLPKSSKAKVFVVGTISTKRSGAGNFTATTKLTAKAKAKIAASTKPVAIKQTTTITTGKAKKAAIRTIKVTPTT